MKSTLYVSLLFSLSMEQSFSTKDKYANQVIQNKEKEKLFDFHLENVGLSLLILLNTVILIV